VQQRRARIRAKLYVYAAEAQDAAAVLPGDFDYDMSAREMWCCQAHATPRHAKMHVLHAARKIAQFDVRFMMLLRL